VNLQERNLATNYFFDECKKILDSKGRDYSPKNEAFGEVHEIAKELEISPEKVLWVYLRKHYTSIKKFIRDKQLHSEPMETRLYDLANYCALLFALIEDGKKDSAFKS